MSVRTVFLLGAGASVPYGFPAAPSLKREILLDLSEHKRIWRGLRNKGHAPESIETFRVEFMESTRQTIDQFLSGRQDLKQIGKEVIAAALIPYEDPQRLFNTDPAHDWYGLLFDNLVLRAGGSRRGLGDGQCSVVTFNYDRSLEHTLAKGYQRSFNTPPAEAMKALSQVPIHHVYGPLGEYDMVPTSGKARPFEPHSKPEAIQIAADAIRVMSDEREDQVDETAARMIRSAQRLVVIGFSFDRFNVKRLGLPWRDGTGINPTFFSAYGMKAGEIHHIKLKVFANMARAGDPASDGMACVREWGIFSPDYGP